MTGGNSPLVYEVQTLPLISLQNVEQFVRFVSRASGTILLKIDMRRRSGSAQTTECMADVLKELGSVRGVSIDAFEQIALVRLVMQTLQHAQLSLPTFIVFSSGKAVLPVIRGADSPGMLRKEIEDRLLYVQENVGDGLCTAMMCWLNGIWKYMQGVWSYLSGFWLTKF